MKSRIVLAACVAASIVAPSVAVANAPYGQYGIFNGSDVTIHDLQTQLTWERHVSPGAVDYNTAQTYCNAFGSGFRLPTVKELLTLVDEEPHQEYDPDAGSSPARYIDPNAFPGTPPTKFWTLSSSGSGQVMTVHFGNGVAAGGALTQGDLARVRCVR